MHPEKHILLKLYLKYIVIFENASQNALWILLFFQPEAIESMDPPHQLFTGHDRINKRKWYDWADGDTIIYGLNECIYWSEILNFTVLFRYHRNYVYVPKIE